jgi:hypothetical protein
VERVRSVRIANEVLGVPPLNGIGKTEEYGTTGRNNNFEEEVQRNFCTISVLECDFIAIATGFVRLTGDFTA